jgi:L-malate glycosyltransferase
MTQRIDQIMPALVYGDAMGNHAMEIWKLLRELGMQSTIYAEHIDPRYAHAAKPYKTYKDEAGKLLIYHFGIGSNITHFIPTIKHSKVAMYYHNITPPEFFEDVNPGLTRALLAGREELPRLKDMPRCIAASEYNRIEMLNAGFKNVEVAHYLVDLARLDAGARTASADITREKLKSDRFTLLFVGRIAPNKCQHDLIHLVEYYRKLIDPDVRLLIVGSHSNADGYYARLQAQIELLDIAHNVQLVGPVGTDDGLGAVYALADAFVCMSEHEGFCIPLIEAMHYKLPVFAFKATGVPYTLGDSAIQFAEKRLDVVAEAIHTVRNDAALRSAIINRQTQQLERYEISRARAQLKSLLDAWSKQ